MLRFARESLTLVLLAVLPFHALLVTVLTKWMAGPGLAPLPTVAIWKEALLAAILFLACLEIIYHAFSSNGDHKVMQIDRFDILIALLLVLAIFVSYFTHQTPYLFAYGFKYDFVPLVLFLLLRPVRWSDGFKNTILKVLLAVGGVVSIYSIISFFLPQEFFVNLGYSDLHSLYKADGPLAAFQQIGGTAIRRVQGPMSGPNQLGLWLLIPWSIAMANFVIHHLPSGNVVEQVAKFFEIEKKSTFTFYLVYIIVIGIALVLTFSRTAWIAAVIITLLAFWTQVSSSLFERLALRTVVIFISAVLLISLLAPDLLLRFASSRDHLVRPLEAVQTMISHPLGKGLGTAGPASNRVSETCVFLEEGADAAWASDRPDLCVFVGENQVQPRGKTCECPFLSENWYLQIGVELGFVGFFLFLALVFYLIKALSKMPKSSLNTSVFLMFTGISVAALLLHAWEDSAVAYTVWILLAVCFIAQKEEAQS